MVYRLGGAMPMQLQIGVRLGSQMTYAALQDSEFRSLDCMKAQT